MVLSYPDEVWAALRDHQAGRRVGLATYQGGFVDLDVDTPGSVSFQASGEIQCDASILVKGYGDSLVPKSKTDFLAPYGQEVTLLHELVVRGQVTQIPLGVFRVTGNSNAVEDVRVVGGSTLAESTSDLVSAGDGLWEIPGTATEVTTGLYAVPSGYTEAVTGLYEFVSSLETVAGSSQKVVLGWSVDVELKDRFRLLQRAKLVTPKSPVVGNSMYEEIRRLALMPVQLNPAIPDVAVPAGMVYESGRLDAIRALAELAGAAPHLTRQGVLTLRVLDAWAEPVLTPVFDIEGTITWQDGQSDEFVNYVRAASTDDEFVAFAFISDDSDPLSVNRAGLSTFEHKSPLYTTHATTAAGAATVLQRLRSRRSREVQVTCTPEALLLELGDVGWVRDPVQDRAVLGEVTALEFPNDVTEPVGVTLIVAEEL